MLSFSNFGSNAHASAQKVPAGGRDSSARARPELAIDGEMQADTAVMPEILEENLPVGAARRAGERADLPRAQLAPTSPTS